MPQPPTVPQVPVLTYFDPNKVDRGLIEYVSTENAGYVPLDVGVPHPNTREYPGFRLGIQQAVPNNFGWIRRVYVTDETNPDWFNAQQKFSRESDSHPIFIRSYREDKKTYVPRTKLTPLDTVTKITVTNAGTGYTPGTYPGLTFVGGGGSGALGRAIVAADGSIAEFVLDSGGGTPAGGNPYTTAPTFTVDPPPSGVTATGDAFIQPQTALLVAEDAAEYPNDSEFFGLFFNVTRVYETLPGPILTTKTVGQPNLTPAKYRRLVRTEETDQPVAADYAFPPGLTGDQTEIKLQQETVAKARLEIISEIIAISGDALIGGETNEFGPLVIYESVVNEGTAIDEGFLVLKSTVTPFGNGKAVKITVKYPLDLALKQIVQKSLGQDNLIPEKYRRLVRHNVTESMVDPALYIFPIKLYGDEAQVSYIEETINRARLKVIEEVIDNITALQGQDTDEFGVLQIYESIVVDGTAVDSGFLIKRSTVTPLGNGKSIKITVIYTNAVVVAVKVVNGGSGYDPGTHTGAHFAGGGGTGALFTWTASGGGVLQDSIVVTNQGTGYTSLPTPVILGGTGAVFLVYLGTPLLTSRLYDEEMQIHYDQTRQIVMIGTPDSADVDYVSEETRALDVFRSSRIRTRKVPAATNAASSIQSTAFRPYKFPGTLDVNVARVTNCWLGYRSARADLVKVNIKTWWVLSNAKPIIAFDEIIADTITIVGVERIERFSDVLHDLYVAPGAYASQAFLATNPSYSEYYLGTLSGTFTNHNSISCSDCTHPGYQVGDVLFLGGVGGTAQIRILSIQPGGYIWSWEVINEGLGGTYTNPVTATGGSGSGNTFDVISYSVPNYTPGTAWVGTERVISASVTPEREKHLWKIQTSGVIMR